MAYECPTCKKEFTTRGNLDRHINTAMYCRQQRHNDENIYQNFQCEFCKSDFTQKYSLDRHQTKCKSKLKYYEEQVTNIKNQLALAEKEIEIRKEYSKQIINNKNNSISPKEKYPELQAGCCIYGHRNKLEFDDRYKIGMSTNINKTLAQARRNSPYTLICFIIYLTDTDYKLVEKLIKRKFLKQRNPLPHEIVEAPLEEIINGSIDICKVMNISFRLAEQNELDIYNEFINNKENAHDLSKNESNDDILGYTVTFEDDNINTPKYTVDFGE